MTREEAIMVLKNEQPHCGKKALFPEEKKYEAYDVAIKALEQEPKWIPVSEGLPEKAFGCLVTVEEDDIHGEPQRVIYPDFVGYDGETWNDADGKVIPFDVIAWMPLPEPYKALSEDKE